MPNGGSHKELKGWWESQMAAGGHQEPKRRYQSQMGMTQAPDPGQSPSVSERRTNEYFLGNGQANVGAPGSVDSHAPVLDENVVPAGGHQTGEAADGAPPVAESNDPSWPTGYGEPLRKRRRMEEPPLQHPQVTDSDVPDETAVPTDQDVPQILDGESRK